MSFVNGIKNTLRLLYKYATMKVLYPMVYRISALKKIDPAKVVFVEIRSRSLSNNFTLLWDGLTKQGDYRPELFCLGLGSVSALKYIKNSIALARTVATAKRIYICHDSNVFSCLPIRKGTTVTQVWHACGAFKRFGMSSAGIGDKIAGSVRERKRFPTCRNMDYITVSSPEVAWAYAEAFDLHEGDGQSIVPTGISRTDIYFDSSRIIEATGKIRSQIPGIAGRKIVLYAPTFRGDTSDAVLPDAIDIELMRRKLSDDYVLLFKHHPAIKETQYIPDSCKDFAFDFSTAGIDDLLMAADICVSDYSSLVFEYCLLDRPMIFFAYDYDDYLDWRGFYYPFEEFCPGPIVKTTEELAAAVAEAESGDLSLIKSFRDKFMISCDGHATERILALAEK